MATLALPVVGGTTRPLPLPPPIPRDPGDASPAVVCKAVFEELCVLANGDIVCWSADPDGERVYGNVHTDRIEDVYRGPRYREMRQWLLASRPDSWCPTIRSHCPKRIITAPSDYTAVGGRIKTLKLEPVTYCNIKCPACPVVSHFPHDPAVRERRANKLLPLPVMIDVIDQLPHLELMLYYNMGEPFLHKDTVPFLRAAKERLPHLVVATNTNGLVLTPAQIHALGTEALMSKIVFSIDGAEPDSYARYRVGGDLPRVMRKLTSLVETTRAAGNSGRVQIVWQYILFEWNDSEEEVNKAKGIARHLGIPIEWVMTSSPGASKRFVAGSDAWAGLTTGGGSTTHMAAGTSLQNTRLIPNRGTADMDVFRSVPVSGVLTDRPQQSPASSHPPARYSSVLSSPESAVVAPPGATLKFDFRMENRTTRPWGENVGELFRTGVLMWRIGEMHFREQHGCRFQLDAAGAVAGQRVELPMEPGEYELLIDVVDLEGLYWMSDRGSAPLRVRVHTDVAAVARLTCELTNARPLWHRLTAGLFRPPSAPRFRADVRSESPTVTAPVGSRVLVEVGVMNRTKHRPKADLRLGVRLQTQSGETLDAFPTELPAPRCQPGNRATAHVRVPLPGEPGAYRLVFDLFDPDGGGWLGDHGGRPFVLPVTVR